jgi:hypothetical protein
VTRYSGKFLRGRFKSGKEHGENFGGKFCWVYTPYLKKGKLRFASCGFIQAVFLDLASGKRMRRN